MEPASVSLRLLVFLALGGRGRGIATLARAASTTFTIGADTSVGDERLGERALANRRSSIRKLRMTLSSLGDELLGDAHDIRIETSRGSNGSDGVHDASCRVLRRRRLLHGTRARIGNAVLHHRGRTGRQRRGPVQGRKNGQRRRAAKLGSEGNLPGRLHEGTRGGHCSGRRSGASCDCRPGAKCYCGSASSRCRRFNASSRGKTAIAFPACR